MFSAAVVLFTLCTFSLTCRPWSAAPAIVTHDWSLSTYVSSALFNTDRRLLFNTDGSSIFKPRRHHSHHAAFTALLLLLGGVETNPGPAAKLRTKSVLTKDTMVSIGCLNCRSAANKTAVIHDLISDNNLDVLFLSETWFNSDTPTSMRHDRRRTTWILFASRR